MYPFLALYKLFQTCIVENVFKGMWLWKTIPHEPCMMPGVSGFANSLQNQRTFGDSQSHGHDVIILCTTCIIKTLLQTEQILEEMLHKSWHSQCELQYRA